MLDAGPRSASARAVEETTLVELDRSDVLLLVPGARIRPPHGRPRRRPGKADLLLRTRVARNANEEIEEQVTSWAASRTGSPPLVAA
ncbi:MAG: hypothetical protein IPL96_16805 [Holophagaceae bacterium]|nr:hypothetical protein [Holophagaceae bacterium]